MSEPPGLVRLLLARLLPNLPCRRCRGTGIGSPLVCRDCRGTGKEFPPPEPAPVDTFPGNP
jgi:hypothetical protein